MKFGVLEQLEKEMSFSGYVHIEVDLIKKITEKAFLVKTNDFDVWLPKSQIADPEDYEEGDENITLSITEWIAKQKGFEPDEG
jgi:hypothetical protein